MTSQLADGLFLATVLLTVVFLPKQQSTIRGFALAAEAESPPRQASQGRPDARPTGGSLLFAANTVVAVGGSVAMFGGLFADGQLAVGAGVPAVLALACTGWIASALFGSSLSSSLPPERPAAIPLRGELSVVVADLSDGFHRIRTTPAALQSPSQMQK